MLLVGASRPSVASEIGQLTNEGPARTRLEGLIRFGAARAFTLMAGFQLVRALDPGECHLVEEGFVGVVTHRLRQPQAFGCFLFTLFSCRHNRPTPPGNV
jgi:hypothetical protein